MYIYFYIYKRIQIEPVLYIKYYIMAKTQSKIEITRFVFVMHINSILVHVVMCIALKSIQMFFEEQRS